MIIKIDFTVEQAEDLNRDRLSDLFSEAARASLRGYHRIVIARGLANWAVDHLDLSEQHRRHIQRIGQEYAQLGKQFPSAKFKLLINGNAQNVIRSGEGTWIVGIDEALSGSYFSPTSLILEHASNDGDFYSLMLRLVAKRIGFGDLSYELCHGGGSGSGGELTRISKLRRIILCICDTDLKTPYSSKSATFNSVMAAYNRENPIGIAVGTPGREVENFLPLDILRKISSQKRAINKIETLILDQGDSVEAGDCLWLYFDVKSGIAKGSLASHCKSAESRAWVQRKFLVEEEEIEEIDFPALGSGLLEAFIQSNDLQSDFHKFIRSRYFSTHFLNWAEDILWIIAGRKHERTR